MIDVTEITDVSYYNTKRHVARTIDGPWSYFGDEVTADGQHRVWRWSSGWWIVCYARPNGVDKWMVRTLRYGDAAREVISRGDTLQAAIDEMLRLLVDAVEDAEETDEHHRRCSLLLSDMKERTRTDAALTGVDRPAKEG